MTELERTPSVPVRGSQCKHASIADHLRLQKAQATLALRDDHKRVATGALVYRPPTEQLRGSHFINGTRR